ncbi:MAG: FmdB family zinc ribbon protein [Acidimicrobiales bacterium]
MPTYEYRCDHCAKNFDVVQSFHDDPLAECPTCGSPVRKVFGSVGIVFKGSGFYKTDSRSGSGSANGGADATTPAAAATADSGSNGADAGSGAGSADKTPAKAPDPTPAKAPATTAPASGGTGGLSTTSD